MLTEHQEEYMANRKQNQNKQKRNTPRHIIFQLQKIKDKEKNLERGQRGGKGPYL